jgi:phage replication O-like protein O
VFYHQTDIKKALQSGKIPKRFNYNEAIMQQVAKIINFPLDEHSPDKETLKVAQLEDGYTRIANILLESAMSHSFTLRQLRVLLAVIRKTYGFNKKDDVISGSQLAKLTKMSRQKCSTALCELVALHVVIRRTNRGRISVNTNLYEWLNEPPKVINNLNGFTDPKTGSVCDPKTGSVCDPKPVHTINKKDTLKDNINTIGLNSSNLPAKTRHKKSTAFKQFFANYPTYRKGGTDTHAWKAWQSEKLTDDDADNAIRWLYIAEENSPCWQANANDGFALGITKFIRQRQWLTPTPKKQVSTGKAQTENFADKDYGETQIPSWMNEADL